MPRPIGRRTLPTLWLLTITGLLGCGARPMGEQPDDPRCVAQPVGLLHFWPGDGSVRDVVGDADATILDGATYTPGVVGPPGGRAFLFDGIDASVRIDDRPSLNPSTGFTLIAWARLDSGDAFTGPVAGKGTHTDEAFVIDHFDGRWRGFIRTVARDAIQIRSDPYVLGAWTHLALAWDGEVVSFYVDGERVGVGLSQTINTTDSFFAIGYRNEAGFADEDLDFEFEGAIDEIAYVERALTAGEVAEIFAAGSDGLCQS